MRSTQFYICIVRGRIMSESREERKLFKTTLQRDNIIADVDVYIASVYMRYVYIYVL